MDFKIGDIVVLKEERVNHLIKKGAFNKEYFKILNISEVYRINKEFTALFLILNLKWNRKITSAHPYPIEFYRLATENEIKKFKLKNIFQEHNIKAYK